MIKSYPGDDGGPAFPRPKGHNGMTHFEEHETNDDQVGMSLRDYYAAAALPGVINAEVTFIAAEDGPAVPKFDAGRVAHICFVIADAMVKEGSK